MKGRERFSRGHYVDRPHWCGCGQWVQYTSRILWHIPAEVQGEWVNVCHCEITNWSGSCVCVCVCVCGGGGGGGGGIHIHDTLSRVTTSAAIWLPLYHCIM